MILGSHQEDSLDIRVKPMVHPGHLEFIFKIGNSTKTADNHLSPLFFRKMHQKLLKADNFNIAIGRELSLNKINSFFKRKKRLLAGIFRNSDDQMIHKRGCTPDNIQMPISDRVKSTGINPDSSLFPRYRLLQIRFRRFRFPRILLPHHRPPDRSNGQPPPLFRHRPL